MINALARKMTIVAGPMLPAHAGVIRGAKTFR